MKTGGNPIIKLVKIDKPKNKMPHAINSIEKNNR